MRILPLLFPNFMPSFRISLERFPRSIRYELTYIHTYKGDPIEPVAFAGSTSIPWNNEPVPFGSLSAIFLGNLFLGTKKNFEGEK